MLGLRERVKSDLCRTNRKLCDIMLRKSDSLV